MKRFSYEDFRIMPWKNGGGTTTELFRLPDPDNENFLLRLSIADVNSDGPFSHYPGIDRQLLILNGEGCVLNHQTYLTTKTSPYSFSGEYGIDCKLINGAFQDFNVMVKRGWKKIVTSRNILSSYSAKEESFIYLINSRELYHLKSETHSFTEQECIIVSLI